MKRKENQCNGKIGYATQAECNKSVARRNKESGKKVRSYYCPDCNKWHFGHEAKGVLQKNKRSKRVVVEHTPKIHKADRRFVR